MKLDDPRIKFSINSFNDVHVNDLYSWGQTYNINELVEVHGPLTKIQLGGPQYVLDRNATAPTEWTISCLRYFDNGAYSGAVLPPLGNSDAVVTDVDLSVITGSGAASKIWNLQNDQQAVAFPPLPGTVLNNLVPAFGAAYHVVAESCRINLNFNLLPPSLQAPIEKFHCWIARGRPANYSVSLQSFFLSIAPLNQWKSDTQLIFIPDFATTVNVAGFDFATRLRINSRIYFFAQQPLTPTEIIPTPLAVYDVPATENSNEISIPSRARCALITGAGGPPVVAPPVLGNARFNCIS